VALEAESFVSPAFKRIIIMDMGRGLLLWMLGVPLPIILLLGLMNHY